MTSNSRRELLESLRPAYAVAPWAEKVQILNNLVSATGYNRKHATRLLAGSAPLPLSKRERKRTYDDVLLEHVKTLWLAANRICSKRLVAALPVLIPALEAREYIQISDSERQQLLTVSAATIDRMLRKVRQDYGPRKRYFASNTSLRSQIPIRTRWEDPLPGFCEVDLVSHGGQSAAGQFLQTLTLTDIATGWTENQAMPTRTNENALQAIAAAVRDFPIPLRGLDCDNGGEFVNHLLDAYCQNAGVELTRSRAYRKNDQAHVEQKNGAIVRRLVGYDRFEDEQSLHLLTALYRISRLYNNYFQPSFKLQSKTRLASKVSKQHDAPKTPYQRMLADGSVSDEAKTKLRLVFENLDPVELLNSMKTLQSKLWQTSKSDPEALVQSISTPKLKRPKKPQKLRRKPLPHCRPGRKRDTELDHEIWAELERNPALGSTTIHKILLGRYGEAAPVRQTVLRKMTEWRNRHPEFSHLYPRIKARLTKTNSEQTGYILDEATTVVRV
ncbi:MAG: transposase family protein [Cyanobacteriota/Melainabacteria group bacterium]